MRTRTLHFVEDRSVLTRPAPPPEQVIAYGDQPEHIADVRVGTDHPEKRPLVMFIHGGFWRPYYDRTHANATCAAIAAAGWTVASVEYRRIPHCSHSTLEDVRLAISQLPTKLTDHDGSLIVVGHSAGGHLALWAATQCATPAFTSVLALAPIADLQYAFDYAIGDRAVLAFIGDDPSTRWALDPCRLPSPSMHVTLIHGRQDAIAPLQMSENYLANHPKARLVRVDQCGHFALIDPNAAAWTVVLEELWRLS